MMNSSALIQDKVVLVTGAGSGIGRASAIMFARRGAKVIAVDINEHQGEETLKQLKEISSESMFRQVDVTRSEQVAEMVEQIVANYGRLDCAFNNAGILGRLAPTADYSEEEWDRVVGIHLKGVWLCMKYELQHMVSRRSGSIVNTSSIVGLVGFRNSPAYVASKHGIIGLTKAAALEYSDYGIRVNAICPGAIRTPMLAELYGQGNKQAGEKLLREREEAGGRIASPEQVAEAVVWLSSEAASFITGHALPIDGGYTAE